MSTRFPLSVLKAGGILRVALLHDGGVLLEKGSTLSERHLRQLGAWGIQEVETAEDLADAGQLLELPAAAAADEVMDLKALGLEREPERFVPPGYDIEGGATYMIEAAVEHTATPIVIEKNVFVNGAIRAGVQLEARGSLQVVGGVEAGARLVAKSALSVRGSVAGTGEQPVTLQAERLELHAVRHGRLTAGAYLKAITLDHCLAKVGGEVTVAGGEQGIVAGEIEAGVSIAADQAEGSGPALAVLRVVMQRQKQLFLSITRLEKSIQDKTAEIAKLEKVIEVVRILGEKVVTLPPEKKQELALQSKRYLDLKSEVAQLAANLERIRKESADDDASFDACPIRLGKILPGVEISLGAATLRLNNRQGATGYHLKGGRILALSP